MSITEGTVFVEQNKLVIEDLNFKKPLILNTDLSVFYGTLKYFDSNKNYGFIVKDVDNSEIFFHFDNIKNNRYIN